MGILGDRMEKRHFIIIGPLFAAVFMSAVGLAPTYGLLLICIVIGGFGTASFHPQSVSMAGDVSGSRRGFGVSLFIVGGTAGLAASPFLMTRYVGLFGLENIGNLSVVAAVVYKGFTKLTSKSVHLIQKKGFFCLVTWKRTRLGPKCLQTKLGMM